MVKIGHDQNVQGERKWAEAGRYNGQISPVLLNEGSTKKADREDWSSWIGTILFSLPIRFGTDLDLARDWCMAGNYHPWYMGITCAFVWGASIVRWVVHICRQIFIEV